jgi:hypothetical protein
MDITTTAQTTVTITGEEIAGLLMQEADIVDQEYLSSSFDSKNNVYVFCLVSKKVANWIEWDVTDKKDVYPEGVDDNTDVTVMLENSNVITRKAYKLFWGERGHGTSIVRYRINKEQSEPVPDKDGWIPWEAGELNIAPKELNPYDSVEYKLKDTSRGIGRNLVRDLFWCKGEGSTIICYKKV